MAVLRLGALFSATSSQRSEPINQNDDIGCLGRGAGAAGTHSNIDVSGRKRRCIVDAVADHESGMLPLLKDDCFDLVRWFPVGEYSVEIERRPNRFGRLCTIPCDHYDACHAGGTQRLHGAGRLAPQLIGQE